MMKAEGQAVPFDLDAVGVASNGASNRYFLLGGKCTSCGRLFFPKREVCPACFDQGKVDGIELDPLGTVVSFTVIRRAPDRKVPFAIGYVRTGDGLIVFGPLTGCDMDRLRVGMEVRCLFSERERADGERWVVYEFVPVRESECRGEAQ